MNTIFGELNLHSKQLQINNHVYCQYEDENYICTIYGDVWIDEKLNQYPLIIQ